MTNEEAMQMMTDMGLHEGGMDNWVMDNAYVKFANKVEAKERKRITELVDEYDGWIARQISGEPEEPLPDVDRAALLKELLPEITKLFNVAYKERS
jgi:hypothetical protein